MDKEPDPTIRASVSLKASEWKQIEEYRDDERAVTTADALRRLVREALRAHAKKKEAKK